MTTIQRILLHFGILTVISPALFTAADQPPPKNDDGWKTFTSNSGRFAVEIPPGSAVEETENHLKITLKSGGDFYQVSWWSIGEQDLETKSVEQLLNAIRDRLVANPPSHVEGKLRTDKKVTIGHFSGREIEIKMSGIKAGGIVITDIVHIMRARLLTVKEKIYMPYIVATEELVSACDTTRFLNSFRVVEPTLESDGRAAGDQRAPGYRTWTDDTGKHKVEAALLELTGDAAKLKRKSDGKLITVPLTRLSKNDVRFLDQEVKPANLKPAAGGHDQGDNPKTEESKTQGERTGWIIGNWQSVDDESHTVCFCSIDGRKVKTEDGIEIDFKGADFQPDGGVIIRTKRGLKCGLFRFLDEGAIEFVDILDNKERLKVAVSSDKLSICDSSGKATSFRRAPVTIR